MQLFISLFPVSAPQKVFMVSGVPSGKGGNWDV